MDLEEKEGEKEMCVCVPLHVQQTTMVLHRVCEEVAKEGKHKEKRGEGKKKRKGEVNKQVRGWGKKKVG